MNHRGVLFTPATMLLWCLIAGGFGMAHAQDSPHGKLSFACEECHSPDSWKEMPRPAKFDHARAGFVLKGQHAQVACMDCHTALTFRFKKSATRCADCHQDVHNGELGATCDRCHSVQSWLVPDMVQKHSATRFSLVGMHATVPCQECHANEQKHQYVGLRTDCYGCHQRDYDGTTAPNHRASGLGTDCQSCHAVNAVNWGASFAGGAFDHAKTGFPLVGAHASIACVRCHAGNVFGPLSVQCATCHGNEFATAKSPPHTGFSTDCTGCHTMTAWQPATFDHNTRTTFPLTGGHTAVTCQQCHASGVFQGLGTNCYSCHQQDMLTKATTPTPHAGFPTDCSGCHTTNPGWAPSTFNHSTVFVIAGAHAALACNQCHTSATNWSTTATTCIGCHQQDFATANSPPHTGFTADCTGCHTNTAWSPATFDHTKNTSFPLTGAHTTVTPCTACHVSNVYAGLSTACFSCHQQDELTKATAPVPHTGFPTDCSGCHTTNPGWAPSTFNHSTVFVIAGAHLALACNQCHTSATNWSTTATTCIGCHQQDFTSANSPPHTGFNTDCTRCHTNTAWSPATFDHTANTSFPLTGAHTTVTPCTACHVNNVYAGLSTLCYSCHSAQFTSAASPVPHTGFATTCNTCHTTNPGWTPSTYSHANASPRFPQDSRHLNAGCAKCHQTATNYTTACCQSSGCHSSCQGGGS